MKNGFYSVISICLALILILSGGFLSACTNTGPLVPESTDIQTEEAVPETSSVPGAPESSIEETETETVEETTETTTEEPGPEPVNAGPYDGIEIVKTVKQYIGKTQYLPDGTGIEQADGAGFASAVFSLNGMDVPRFEEDEKGRTNYTQIPLRKILPGDLLLRHDGSMFIFAGWHDYDRYGIDYVPKSDGSYVVYQPGMQLSQELYDCVHEYMYDGGVKQDYATGNYSEPKLDRELAVIATFSAYRLWGYYGNGPLQYIVRREYIGGDTSGLPRYERVTTVLDTTRYAVLFGFSKNAGALDVTVLPDCAEGQFRAYRPGGNTAKTDAYPGKLTDEYPAFRSMFP